MTIVNGIDSTAGQIETSIKIFEIDNSPNAFSAETLHNISNSHKVYRNYFENNLAGEFRDMQRRIMDEHVPILEKLLLECEFEAGYESEAEIYYSNLYSNYGLIADTILQNIYLDNMYKNTHVVKHLLFIIANLPIERRNNLTIVPLAGLSNPDIEIQDLSVQCFESWKDSKHIPTLQNLANNVTVLWFKKYIEDVIEDLK